MDQQQGSLPLWNNLPHGVSGGERHQESSAFNMLPEEFFQQHGQIYQDKSTLGSFPSHNKQAPQPPLADQLWMPDSSRVSYTNSWGEHVCPEVNDQHHLPHNITPSYPSPPNNFTSQDVPNPYPQQDDHIFSSMPDAATVQYQNPSILQQQGVLEVVEPFPGADLPGDASALQQGASELQPKAGPFRNIFSNIQEARDFMDRTRWYPEDRSIPISADELPRYVQGIYEAMINTEGIEDNLPKKGTRNHVTPWIEGEIDQREIEARAWEVMFAIINLHVHGSTMWVLPENKSRQQMMQKRLSLVDRYLAVCNTLRLYKSECKNVMTNEGIEKLVNGPNQRNKRNKSNKCQNNLKRVQLSFAKQHKDEIERAQTSRNNELQRTQLPQGAGQGSTNRPVATISPTLEIPMSYDFDTDADADFDL